MTAQSKTTIKSYFETGDFPTQGQFADLIDSYQDVNSNLTTLASASQGAFGLNWLSVATTAAALNQLAPSTIGSQLFQTPTTAAAQGTLGAGAFGSLMFSTATTAAAQSQLEFASGTWTPVLTFATPGNLSVNYNVQIGSYYKIGNQVTINFDIQTSSFTFTTASGNLNITGLPFTPNNTANRFNAGAMSFSGITKAGYTNYVLYALPGSTGLTLVASGTGVSQDNVTAANMPSGGNVILIGTLTYFI